MGKEEARFFVAIVDDEAALREAISSLLRSAGFRAEGFATAEEFLQSSRRDQAACLVLDGALPGMRGLDLQRHLTGIGSVAPIVFITAHEDRDGEMHARALRGGAIAFLHKPFSDEDLLSAVRVAFDRVE